MQQTRRLVFFAVVAAALGCGVEACRCAGAAPPPPAVYDVQIHYQVHGFGKEQVAQYFALTGFLKNAGFVRADVPDQREPEDPRNLPFRGTVPSDKARLLLGDPRVQCIRLMPQGAKLPDDKAALLRVHLELPSNLGTQRQIVLTDQVRRVLNEIGFKEGAVYDHHGYTRLVGALPVGQIDTVLNDLRKQPTGATLPPPFSIGPPIRVVEVLPTMPQLAPRPVSQLPPPELEKLSAELRQLVADKAKANEPLRFETILALTPDPEDREWIRMIRKLAPDVFIEGRLGPMVTASGPRGQIVALAARPEVAAVRLPRPPRPWFVDAKPAEGLPAATREAILQQLKGKIAKGDRVAVVDGDFRGWEALRDAFPEAQFHLVDLTRERNRDLLDEPYPFAGPGPGQGTRFAETLLRAAPSSEVTLICVDPAAPYQVETVARAIDGERLNSLALALRLEDLLRRRDLLDLRKADLAVERRRVFEDFRIEDEAVQNRKNYRKKQADHDCDEAAYRAAMSRYLQLEQALRDLKGIRLVLTPLAWYDGYPLNGASALSRFFDERPYPLTQPTTVSQVDRWVRPARWLVYAGETRGQAWVGLFRDRDHNDVMEFAPPEPPLLPGRWTKEMNFLAWRPAKGEQSADLPANAVLRVTLQWQEAHETDLLRSGEDPYREPLANLRLTLVHQPDPAGAKQPDDDMEIVAESVGTAQRLSKTLNSGVYEQAVLFRVPKAGRYAVRITGRAPAETRPPGVPSVPTARRTFELWSRLFVSTLDGDGRAVLADYSTDAGSVGTPADARRVERVGP
jgi:hypothetical protein